MQVMPALLTQTPEELKKQLIDLSPHYKHYQIDVADGKLVPNTTLQIAELEKVILDLRSKIQDLTFDFHLMVEDYDVEITQLEKLKSHIKIETIFVHASRNPDFISLTESYPFFSFGLVLNPEDDPKTILSKYDPHKISNIQLMTIKPGFQGQSFIPEVLQKIQQIKAMNYKTKIYLDGSINETTIPMVKQQKNLPDFLCIGSYLSQAKDIAERVKKLEELLK